MFYSASDERASVGFYYILCYVTSVLRLSNAQGLHTQEMTEVLVTEARSAIHILLL
jgi:hypothetical protein